MKVLPENILKRISPKDRQILGKAGATSAEAQAVCDARSEKQLQKQIAEYLNSKAILFVSPTYGKRTRIKSGWPDFTFSYFGQMCCIEAKAIGAKPSDEQAKVIDELRGVPNCARVLVAYKLDAVRDFLMAVENQPYSPRDMLIKSACGEKEIGQ